MRLTGVARFVRTTVSYTLLCRPRRDDHDVSCGPVVYFDGVIVMRVLLQVNALFSTPANYLVPD